jgi:hypothetical protein
MSAEAACSRLLTYGADGPSNGTSARSLERLASELEQLEPTLPSRIDADPEQVERGLAKLVLTVIELLRRLLEKQAIRRIEGGSLTDDEIERMGLTFMRLAERMKELQVAFGLSDENLNLNLGPLGNLL